MSTFQPGEIVDVTIKGVRIDAVYPDGAVVIRDEHGDPHAMPPQAAVTRVAPAEWPPRPGDLWRDREGDLWFALTSERLISPEGSPDGDYAEGVGSSALGPLTLVHREDEQDGAEPSETAEPRPVATVDDLARALSDADVKVNDGDYPAWDDLADSGRHQYRQCARYLLARYTVTTPEDEQDGSAS